MLNSMLALLNSGQYFKEKAGAGVFSIHLSRLRTLKSAEEMRADPPLEKVKVSTI